MALWKRKKTEEVPPVPVDSDWKEDTESPSSVSFVTPGRNADGRRIDALLDAIASVSASRDLEDLLHHVVDSAISTTGAERGILLLETESGQDPQVRVARGAGTSLSDVRYSTSVVAKVMKQRTPMRSTVRAGENPLDLGASVVDLKLRAVMCVPVDARGDTIGSGPRGVLYVDSTAATREFNDADLTLFHALGQHIAIALENARLGQEAVERARLQRSLEIAEEIQIGLMPSASPNVPGFTAQGWFRAAEHAAGDFFDFVPSGAGSLTAVVGDVSGHGIGPALVTATAQAGLRAYLRVVNEPNKVMNLLNQDLCSRMEVGMFLTLVLAQVEPDGALQLVNAGHPPPLIWRNAERRIDRLDEHELAVGLSDNHDFERISRTHLGPGDVLLVYSDGLVEARHPDYPDRLFGEEGLRAVISDVGYRGGGPDVLVQELADAVLEFSDGSREDDMTMVAISIETVATAGDSATEDSATEDRATEDRATGDSATGDGAPGDGAAE